MLWHVDKHSTKGKSMLDKTSAATMMLNGHGTQAALCQEAALCRAAVVDRFSQALPGTVVYGPIYCVI